MIASLAQLMVSQWIWSITLGIYHPAINCMIMILLLMYVARKRFLVSFMYALSSQGFAIMALGLLAHLMLHYIGESTFDDQVFMTLHPLATSLVLGSMYAFLQMLFFYCARLMWHMPFKSVVITVCLSNFMAALMVFRFMPVL